MGNTLFLTAEPLFIGLNILGRLLTIWGTLIIVLNILEKQKGKRNGIIMFVSGLALRFTSAFIMAMQNIDYHISPGKEESIRILGCLTGAMACLLSHERKSKQEKTVDQKNSEDESINSDDTEKTGH